MPMNPFLDKHVTPAAASQARRQLGLITREQLLAERIAPATIAGWLRRGMIDQVFQGIYRVGGSPNLWLSHALASQLYVSRQARRMKHQPAAAHVAALSGVTAAWVFDFPNVTRPDSPYVATNRLSRAAVLTGHLPGLTVDDVTWHRNVPLTIRPLTFLESCAVLGPPTIENLLIELPRRGDFSLTELAAVMQRFPESAGLPDLLIVSQRLTPDLYKTRSGKERLVVRGLAEHDITDVHVNHKIRFPEANIEFDLLRGNRAAEIDGPHHLLPSQVTWDRERDRIAKRHGIEVKRWTTADLDRRPTAAIIEIIRHLQPGWNPPRPPQSPSRSSVEYDT